MVLLSVLRLGSDAYGVSVHEELGRTTGRETKRGAVYVALERLAAKGYVSSRFGDPTAERGGRAKRYYAVEPAGRTALRASRQALMHLWSGIEPELEDR
ncbi:MAG: PadR family transcriptional regulator [Acidobacteria bacterium]|nr:PadR family transcriptional regulator [Acidobacteriota bacterium]